MRPWPQSDKANTGSRRWESAFAEVIRKPCAPSQSHTQPESLGKPPPVAQANRQWANRCGRWKALTMSGIARGFPPTRPLARRIACPISMGHYQRSLV